MNTVSNSRLLSVAAMLLVASSFVSAATLNGDMLLAAANEGDIELARAALSAGVDPKYASSTIGLSALHIAVRRGDLAIARLLLSHGADPNARDELGGKTPLLIAVERGDTICARMLLGAGADSSARDFLSERSAWELALADESMVEAFKLPRGISDVPVAPSASTAPISGRALDMDEWRRDSEYIRLLMHRDTEAALRQLRDGADTNAKDPSGYGILHLLAYKNDIATARFVLGLGAEVDVRDALGATPFMTAAQMGDSEMCALLLDAGADVNALNCDSGTAFFYACQNPNMGLIRNLFARGATVNVQPRAGTWKGWTPLMLAVAKNNIELVIALLDWGADVTVRNANGWTAYKIAVANGKDIPADLIKQFAETRGLKP